MNYIKWNYQEHCYDLSIIICFTELSTATIKYILFSSVSSPSRSPLTWCFIPIVITTKFSLLESSFHWWQFVFSTWRSKKKEKIWNYFSVQSLIVIVSLKQLRRLQFNLLQSSKLNIVFLRHHHSWKEVICNVFWNIRQMSKGY